MIVLTAALGCAREATPEPEDRRAAGGVATVEGEVIAGPELQLAPGASEDARRRALDQLIFRRLAAREARRRGLAAEQEIEEKLLAIEREASVRQEALLRDALFASVRDGLAFTDDDLRAHYEATKVRYAERQFRLLRRSFATRDEAERALGEDTAIEGESAEILGPAAVRELPRTVLPEALRLDRPGARAVAGSDEEGWSVIELVELLAAAPRPFEAVRAEVGASLRQAEAAVAFRALLDELRTKADVRVDEEALARIAAAREKLDRGMPRER